jgi:uncharacterized membrane protein YciS (DUF1049 family)
MEIILFFVGLLAVLMVMPIAIGKMILETIEYRRAEAKAKKVRKQMKLIKEYNEDEL